MHRIKVIQYLINLNEKLLFYPFLKKYYKNKLSKTPVILDVGANKGQTIDFFIKIRKNTTFYAFEANAKLIRTLKRKYKKNKNVNIIPKGISNANTIAKFHVNKLDETSSFENLNYNSSYLLKKAKILGIDINKIIENTIDVETLTLLGFLMEKSLPYIDLIKIDVEGHEYKCLDGLFNSNSSTPNLFSKLSTRIERIQIEYHVNDSYEFPETFQKTEDLMSKNNFILEKKIRHGFGHFYDCIFKNTS
jgi:FkbM family methyltransferase